MNKIAMWIDSPGPILSVIVIAIIFAYFGASPRFLSGFFFGAAFTMLVVGVPAFYALKRLGAI